MAIGRGRHWRPKAPGNLGAPGRRGNSGARVPGNGAPGRRGKEWTSVVSIPTDGETGDVQDQVDPLVGRRPTSPVRRPRQLHPETLDAAGRAQYLAEVMADIDAEVKRRRASGDLPAGLERELDELFLEFSPVGMQGKARLRETLALVDGAAFVDTAVPVLSNKAVGVYVKRLIRKSTSWYMNFVVHQIVRFAWSVSRMLHLVVDHIEDLEATVDAHAGPGAARVGRTHRRRGRVVVGADRHRSRPGRRTAGCSTGSAATGRWWRRWWGRASTPTGWSRASRRSSPASSGAWTSGPSRSSTTSRWWPRRPSVPSSSAGRCSGCTPTSAIGWCDWPPVGWPSAASWSWPRRRPRPGSGRPRRSSPTLPRGDRCTQQPGRTCWPATACSRSPSTPAARIGRLAKVSGIERRRRGHQRGHRCGQRARARTGRVRAGRGAGAVTAVHQFVPALLPRDATGDHTLALREALRAEGWQSDIYVEAAHDELQHEATLLRGVHPAVAVRGTSSIYQASTGSPVAEYLLGRPETLVLDYHNITPASFYAPWEPHTAEKVTEARAPGRRPGPTGSIGRWPIRSSARTELASFGCPSTVVVPILVSVAQWSQSPDPEAEAAFAARADGGTVLLFVGRLSPNKAQHELVQALWLYRRWYDPKARLLLVGPAITGGYADAVVDLAAELGLAGAVVHGEHLTSAELAAWYGAADVFVCLSDHEGFCIPLLEAMQFDLPIVAFAAGAVPETVGPAGILLEAKRPSVVAAAIDRVRSDAGLAGSLVALGRRRLRDFEADRTRNRFVEVLQALDGQELCAR